MHTPYSPPLLSFLIWSFPPFFVQFTEAGLGSPAFLLGRSAGTLTREASQDLNHAGKTPYELHPQRPPDNTKPGASLRPCCATHQHATSLLAPRLGRPKQARRWEPRF